MTYRDMTFCTAYSCAKFGPLCHRSLTEQVQASANRAGLPVCQFVKPEELNCYLPTTKTTITTTHNDQ